MESSTDTLVSGGESSEGRGGEAGELGDSCTEKGNGGEKGQYQEQGAGT